VLDCSLPKAGEPLRDWQAVVIGGGVINGLSLQGVWPGPRLKELVGADRELAARWDAALAAAVTMADNDKVPAGTRYDALRMVPLLGWDKAGPQLTKYLAKGTHAELQMGAVSGLSDVDAKPAAGLLVDALAHLTGQNRKLALEALLRTADRAAALLDAVEAGKVKPDALGADAVRGLREHKAEPVRTRAAKVLP
jgi:roadblock/LC7 domain-containing protein